MTASSRCARCRRCPIFLTMSRKPQPGSPSYSPASREGAIHDLRDLDRGMEDGVMDTHRTIEAVWRIESPRLIAVLTRMVRDVGVAEDLAQDALVAALEQWPQSGVPRNPGAWLMAIAKRRAIDGFRRAEVGERKYAEFGVAQESQHE